MENTINDIRHSYLLGHEKYKHTSHGQFIFHYVVLIYIGIISLLAITTEVLARMSIIRLNIFNYELVALVLIFPTVLTALWILYYARMVKCRKQLALLKADLQMLGQLVCYDTDDSYPQAVHIKAADELGERYRVIDYSASCFDEYDRVFSLKNRLL